MSFFQSYLFNNRADAGLQLASKLQKYTHDKDAIVIGLPRGGIVTGYYVAQQLKLPLDMVVPRKIGAPHNEEMAVGAITEDGAVELDRELMYYLRITPEMLKNTIEEERKEAARRLKLYRGNRSPLNLEGKTVLLVDDGIATGATAKAAIHSLRSKGASKIVLAVPVAPPDTLESMSKLVDEIVVVSTPHNFRGVGQFYKEFTQTTDQEVMALMKKNEEDLEKKPSQPVSSPSTSIPALVESR